MTSQFDARVRGSALRCTVECWILLIPRVVGDSVRVKDKVVRGP